MNYLKPFGEKPDTHEQVISCVITCYIGMSERFSNELGSAVYTSSLWQVHKEQQSRSFIGNGISTHRWTFSQAVQGTASHYSAFLASSTFIDVTSLKQFPRTLSCWVCNLKNSSYGYFFIGTAWTNVYTIPVASPVISNSFHVSCQVTALLHCEQRRSTGGHGYHSGKTLNFLN